MKLKDFENLFPARNLPLDSFIGNSAIFRDGTLAEADFPHRFHHTEQITKIGFVIAHRLRLPLAEMELIRAVAFLHDLGYGFSEIGVIKHYDHHLASTFIAGKLLEEYPDIKAITQGILLHTRDVLPANTPSWIRVLRDADRLAGVGPSGILTDAYYLGFKHPRIVYPPEPFSPFEIPAYLPVDTRWPWEPNYEKESRAFCWKFVFPYLAQNYLDLKIAARTDEHRQRFFGKMGKRGKWKIEPILPIAQELFADRIKFTIGFTQRLLEYDLVSIDPNIRHLLRHLSKTKKKSS
jgi:hypothetical protein